MDTKKEEWKVIPSFPKYEMNKSGEVRIKASKVKKMPSSKDGRLTILVNSPTGYFEMIPIDVTEILAELFPVVLYSKSEKSSPHVIAPEVGQVEKAEIPALPVLVSEVGQGAKPKGTYIIHGVRYKSAREAAKALGCTHRSITTRIEAGKEGYLFEPVI